MILPFGVAHRCKHPVRLLCGLSAGGFLAACATIPEGVTEADVARYDAAVASLGCTIVTEPDYLAVELQTGLSRAQLMDITAYRLSSDGAERLPGGGVKLITGGCA